MLEIHRRNQDIAPTHGTCRLILHVVKDVLSNPIVFMVLVGIAGNFLFKQKVPNVLDDILEVLGKFSTSVNHLIPARPFLLQLQSILC